MSESHLVAVQVLLMSSCNGRGVCKFLVGGSLFLIQQLELTEPVTQMSCGLWLVTTKPVRPVWSVAHDVALQS